ncbi:MAG: malate synthase G, partial [Pseudomonadota bacterium]|nr:malate synthase G [Pseudomonadota bacterium]
MQAIVGAENVLVHEALYEFVNREALPGTGIDEKRFWSGFALLLRTLTPRNSALLRRRDELQSKIDAWHRQHPGPAFDRASYQAYLREIGYWVPEQAAFSIETVNVDAEIAAVAGPQLVVPVNNARYALNAANARWGSLYDALYGTDAIPEGGTPRAAGYDTLRGAKVIAFARDFLDHHFALNAGSHHDAVGYRLTAQGLDVTLKNGSVTRLQEPAAVRGYQGQSASPSLLLLVHHGLHVELHFDRGHVIGRDDAAGISDVVLESAITTIQDCEDSVAAVDAADKVQVYGNWLGLMKGSLEAQVAKGGKTLMRRLNPDRQYKTLTGKDLVLPGRSLMLVRNVGSHLLSDMVTLDGKPTPE